jgi:hypothetical protein
VNRHRYHVHYLSRSDRGCEDTDPHIPTKRVCWTFVVIHGDTVFFHQPENCKVALMAQFYEEHRSELFLDACHE